MRHPGLRAAFGTVILAGAGYALWRTWHDPALADLPANVQLWPVLLSLLVRTASSFGSARVWLALLRGVGGEIHVRDALRIYVVTNIAKYVPGKVLQIAGRVALLQEHGQPAAIGLASVLMELAISLLVSAIVVVICLPAVLTTVGLDEQHWLVVVLALLAVPAGLLGLHPRALGPVLALGSRLALRASSGPRISAPPFRSTLLALACSLALRGISAVAIYATARAVYPLDFSAIPLLAASTSLGYLLGIVLSVAPAGLGVREGVVTVMLSTLIPLPIAIAISVLDRVVSIASELLAAGLGLMIPWTRRGGPNVAADAASDSFSVPPGVPAS